ncbi:MAG: histidine phosphatase family protein [Candidatus Dormibacteraeota bacterium]|nr:histidine phosphatase family protein [Candidatus Dormibacteraeota bacterium]
MKVFLVRHADAGDREAWPGDDASRPLNARGRDQAEALARALGAEGVERVLSSPYLRCVETVQPLTRARQLPVELEEALAEGSGGRGALELVTRAAAPPVLCSQGDVIGELVTAFVSDGLVATPGAHWQKASTWILVVEGGTVTSATYRPPPA